MSATSPSNRGLRAKTSGFADFLQGVSSSAQARSSQHDLSISASGSTSLEVPLGADEGTTTPKKKVTRIPLFGRTRKKSNQSSTSSPFAASSHTACYSSEVGEQASLSRTPSTDRHPSKPLISGRPPPLPTPTNSSSTSKFAAHLSHSQSLKPTVTETEPAKPAVQPSGLYPTNAQRSASIDSSSMTESGSNTLRPHPIITVSLSPDDLSQFHDLFSNPTKPRGMELDVPSGLKASTIHEPSARRRGQMPASVIASATYRRQTASISDKRPPSPSPKNKKSTSDSKSHDRGGDTISTLRQSNSIHESPRSLTADVEKGVPPFLQHQPCVATGSIQSTEGASPSIRSQMKQPSSPSRSKPPSMPLPQPPTSTTPSLFPSANQGPNSPLQLSFLSGITRSRAHTFSASTPPSLRPSRSVTAKLTNTLPSSLSTTAKEGFDIETASELELRKTLKECNLQYKALTSYVLKNTETYLSQIAALEKKISSLEFEACNHEKTIQGLIHIIGDANSQDRPKPLPVNIMNLSHFASSAGSGAESDQDVYKSVRPSIPHWSNYHSDPGDEL